MTAATIAPTTSNPAGTSATTARTLDERRMAGIGAVTFATIVVTTNILLSGQPAFDAGAAEVTEYLTDNRAAGLFSTIGFAVAAPFLLAFVTAFYARLKAVARPEDQVWARLGAAGALLLIPTFAAVITQRLVLLVGGDELIGSPELVTLVWRLEAATFSVNLIPLSVAVLGFGIAAARCGLLPRWYAKLAPVAAVGGIVTAASGVAVMEGSQPAMLGGLVAFVSWMLLLYMAGIRQLRSAA